MGEGWHNVKCWIDLTLCLARAYFPDLICDPSLQSAPKRGLAEGTFGLDLVGVAAWFVTGRVFMSVGFHLSMEV